MAFRPRRLLARLGLLLLLLLLLPLLALGGALFWANSEGGRATVARLIAGQVPGLTLEGLGGPLPGRVSLDRMAMADTEGTWLEAEGVLLDLDLRALVGARTLRIEALEARRLSVSRAPLPDPDAPPEPEPARDPDAGLLPQLPSLPVAVQLDRLAVERLELGAPLLGLGPAEDHPPAVFALNGQARLDAGRLNAELTAARQDAPGHLEATLALAPAEDRLTARVALQEPPGGLLAGLVGHPDLPADVALDLDGPASGARLSLRAELGPDLSATAEGTVRAAPDGSAGAVLEGTVRPGPLLPAEVAPLAERLDLALDADLSAEQLLTLRRVRVEAPAGTAEAEGTIELPTEDASLRLSVAVAPSERFAGLLPEGTAAWDALRLSGTVEGRLAAPRVAMDLRTEGFGSSIEPLAAALGPAPEARLEAALPDRLDTLRVQGQRALLEASGQVGEVLGLDFGLRVADLESVAPAGVEGTGLVLNGRAEGPAADPNVTLEATADRLAAAGQVLEALRLSARIETPASAPAVDTTLEGQFSGLPLSARIEGGPETDAAGREVLRLRQAQAALGPARVEASGEFDQAASLFDGTVRLEAQDLAPLSALAGTPLAGRIQAEATLAPTEAGLQGFRAHVAAPSVRVADITATGNVSAEGTPQAADIALSARAEGLGDAEARARVSAEEAGGWLLDLAALRAAYQGEAVRLTAPARIHLRPDGSVETPGLTLALPRGPGTLRAAGSWGPERADLRLVLAQLPAAIAQIAAPDLAVEGTISGEAQVTGPVAAPEARLSLRASGLRMGDDWASGLPTVEAQLQAQGGLTGAAEARLEATAGPGSRVVATLRLPQGAAGANAPIAGALDGALDLGRLAGPLLAAGADRATGRLNLALRVDGTTSAPVLGGRATLAGGEYRNLALGLRVTDVTAALRAEGTRLVLESLRAQTPGDGTIAAQGTVDPLAPGMPVDMTLTARGAQPVISDLFRGTFDADLALSGSLETGARLAGPVRVRRADIQVPEGMPATVRTLDNVTERGSPPGATRPASAPSRPPPAPATAPPPEPTPMAGGAGDGGGPPIALAIVVEAPRAVFVRGRGLDAELGGELSIGGTVASPDIGGALELRRGTFDILTQQLDFTRGSLEFDGIMLPTLDLLATTRSQNVTIQVSITGPPTQPNVAFSSTPELPQDEVLARLLFDRSARNLSPLEAAQLAQALAGVTGIGPTGGGFLDRMRRTLGLDRLAVGGGSDAGTTGTNGAEGSGEQGSSGPTVEAGRYVADGVYVGVQQGTTGADAGSPRVGVRVDLTPRLRLEAQSGGRESGERLGLSWEYEW